MANSVEDERENGRCSAGGQTCSTTCRGLAAGFRFVVDLSRSLLYNKSKLMECDTVRHSARLARSIGEQEISCHCQCQTVSATTD